MKVNQTPSPAPKRDGIVVVASALIDREGRVLVQRRPPGKPMARLWEFPGGKVEHGEAPEAALARELAEELGIIVDPAALIAVAEARVPGLTLALYLARAWQGEPRPLHASELRWVSVEAFGELEMPPADRPLIPPLAALMAATSR